MTSKRETSGRSQSHTRKLVDGFESSRANTLSKLMSFERMAEDMISSGEVEREDVEALRTSLSGAWSYYVASQQLAIELGNRTPHYNLPLDLIKESYSRVVQHPLSDQSRNVGWLILNKMKEDGLIAAFADTYARKPEMWEGEKVGLDAVPCLASHLETEWNAAVESILEYWDRQTTQVVTH
ncbi:hypothetical protein E4U25_003130 [Claviceps purpurea]|nr:hypothetical protein E4U28_007838 [Claviceps purpurea]KAG6214340.1 hypothetical protein E4U50_000445 [Claviceps purpurea]KAG6237010.1 hypothetical protein E4U25_003130 [Claviceps purpurea]KAG6293004.1 hypothetical protein E4U46_008025 [Claviceps purpurea]